MNEGLNSTDQLDFLKEVLSQSNQSTSIADDIVRTLWRTTLFNSLISHKVYLDLAGAFISQKRPSTFCRTDLYKYISDTLAPDASMQVKLETFAFVMELMQVNGLEVNNATHILPTSDITVLVDKCLLKLENGVLSFFHNSIHSYFSAKYLLHNQDLVEFFKKIITTESKAVPIPATWFEVIGNLIEFEDTTKFTKWIASSIRRYPVLIEEDLLRHLELAQIGTQLTPKQKSNLFISIFNVYEDKQVWLPDSAEMLLAALSNSNEVDFLNERLLQSYKTNTDRIVTKGNIVGVLEEILEVNPKLLTVNEDWHERFISFANDDSSNGVLQRRALKALQHYKRSKDIRLLQTASRHPDRLVHEAFLILCYTIAPNDRTTINYLADGLLKGCEIYSRYGFYEINSATGIHNFLSIISSKAIYINKFLENESIFNDRGRHEDEKIISILKRVMSKRILTDSKKFVIQSFKITDGYYSQKSYFLDRLIKLILDVDADFALEVAANVDEEDKLYLFIDLLSKTISLRNYDEVLTILGSRHSGFNKSHFLNYLSNSGRNEILSDAAEKGHIEKRPAINKEPRDNYESQRTERIYSDFKTSLEPEKDKYSPNVFKEYIEHKETINKKAKTSEIERLKHLVKEVILDNFDTKNISVRINNREGGNTNYTITNIAGYYGDVIKVAVELFGKAFIGRKYRENLVSFLPYAYYDERQLIAELTFPLNEHELKYLSSLYSKNEDVRYFLPDSYLFVIEEHIKLGLKFNLPKDVLKSYVADEELKIYDRDSALENLGNLTLPYEDAEKKYFRDTFNKYKQLKGSTSLAITANKFLITVFQDRIAVTWRFSEIEKRAEPFQTIIGQVHTVGPLENELHEKKFGRPLTLLGELYLAEFLDLLGFSFELLEKDQAMYMSYSSYIWSLTFDYFVKFSDRRNLGPLVKLERWYKKHGKEVEGANWFESRMEMLRKQYTSDLNKENDFLIALEQAERYKQDGNI